MSAVHFRFESSILLSVLFVCFIVTECHGKAGQVFLCELHDVEDAMPGLAAFRGENPAGRIGLSIERYRDAIESGDIAEAEGYFCIGELLLSADSQNEALAMFDKSISSDSSFHQHYFSRGQLHTELGDCASALLDFESVLKNGGSGFGVDLARAEALVECDYPAEALETLDASISQIPGETRPVNWSFTKARALAGFGEYNEALQFAEDSVTRISQLGTCLPVMSRCINPRLIEAVDLHTYLLCRTGDVGEAKTVYEQHEKYQRPSPMAPYCLE